MTALIDALRSSIPAERVVTDPDVVAAYAHDEAQWAPYGAPAALVRAASTADVRAVVETCAQRSVPVVPRGAGTGLSGERTRSTVACCSRWRR